MEILHSIRGTAAFDSGANASRDIDVPSNFTGHPSWTLSKFEVTDPADAPMFKFHNLSDLNPAAGTRDDYLGGQRVTVQYSSTAFGAKNVDFLLVFTDVPTEGPQIGYGGN